MSIYNYTAQRYSSWPGRAAKLGHGALRVRRAGEEYLLTAPVVLPLWDVWDEIKLDRWHEQLDILCDPLAHGFVPSPGVEPEIVQAIAYLGR